MSIGYSYRDAHINDLVIQGLRNNPGAKVYALLYSTLEDYSEATQLAHEYTGLSLIGRDGAIDCGIRGTWRELKSNGDSMVECGLGDFAGFAEFLSAQVRRRSTSALQTQSMERERDAE